VSQRRPKYPVQVLPPTAGACGHAVGRTSSHSRLFDPMTAVDEDSLSSFQNLTHSSVFLVSEVKGGWKPSEVPVIPKKWGTSWTYTFGRLLVWGGHLFLIVLPITFIIFVMFFYTGVGTSGVPIAVSIMFSTVLYAAGYALVAWDRRGDAA
jgi:hypothetical protein